MKHKLLFYIVLAIAAAPIVWVVWAFDHTYGSGGVVRKTQCMSSVKNVLGALIAYAADHDGVLPPGPTWRDELGKSIRDDLRCPALKISPGYGYAMNVNLSKARISKLEDPGKQILIFEANDLSRNAVGRPRFMASPPRHRDGNVVGYLDGHAALLQPN